MSTKKYDIFKKYFYPILSNKCSIILCSNSPVFKNQTYVRLSVKCENTDFLKRGRTKNYNKCSVFQVAYKLDYLHTNFIFKPLNENLTKPTKIPTFQPSTQKSQYRSQYRKTPLKSTLSPISNHNPNPQSKPLSSYINTKILRKIPTFTDYQFFNKNALKTHAYIQSKKRNK